MKTYSEQRGHLVRTFYDSVRKEFMEKPVCHPFLGTRDEPQPTNVDEAETSPKASTFPMAAE
jgi:hypothetical protein